MALSISVGVAGYEYLDDRLTKDGCPYSSLLQVTSWEGECECEFEDGTDGDLSCSKNTPHYSMGYFNAGQWRNKYVSVNEFFKMFSEEKPLPIEVVINLVDEIMRESKTKIDKNRARWLYFWCKKALEVFGARAQIEVSY